MSFISISMMMQHTKQLPFLSLSEVDLQSDLTIAMSALDFPSAVKPMRLKLVATHQLSQCSILFSIMFRCSSLPPKPIFPLVTRILCPFLFYFYNLFLFFQFYCHSLHIIFKSFLSFITLY